MSAAAQYSTKKVERGDFVNYLKKAKEFYQTMYQAESVQNWDAVGLNGVHCVISLMDAILVKNKGLRSASEDHLIAADLLNSCSNIEDVVQKSQLAGRIIAKKNLVAYELRNFTETDARDMIKQVQRFYDWAIKIL